MWSMFRAAALLALLWFGLSPGRLLAQSCNGGGVGTYGYAPAAPPYAPAYPPAYGGNGYAPPASYSAPPAYSFPPPSVYAAPSMPYTNGGYYSAPPAPAPTYPTGVEYGSYAAPYEFERRYGLRGQLRFERYRGQPLLGGGRVICGPNGNCYVVR